jgi:DNA-directed RNA polymerase specialized sigma24 family protein
MEGMSAADVARTLAMGSAKAVYNRVYRALERLRALLETKGIGLADL